MYGYFLVVPIHLFFYVGCVLKYIFFIWIIGIEGLCIALRRLAYPNRWKDLERLFGLSNKTLSGIGNHIIDLIYHNKGDLLFDLGELEWLDRNRLTTYAEVTIPKY